MKKRMMENILNLLTLAVILTMSSLSYAGEWIAVDGGSIEIDLNDKENEDDLWVFLSTIEDHKFYPRKEYLYQYQANIRYKLEELHINALCYTERRDDLHREFVVVDDGGTCYFQVKYKFKTGTFYDLSVNGEA